jgi:hypothetical protein
MRRMFVPAALALAALSSPVLADGTIVRWDRVEGVIGADYMPVQVGPFAASGRWRSTGSGQIILDLRSGFLSVKSPASLWQITTSTPRWVARRRRMWGTWS